MPTISASTATNTRCHCPPRRADLREDDLRFAGLRLADFFFLDFAIASSDRQNQNPDCTGTIRSDG
jgi:hypothetical protein